MDNNFFAGLALVGRFANACLDYGWASRPAFSVHIVVALRECGWLVDDRHFFAHRWSLDCGGPGPLRIRWSRPCTACGGRGAHEPDRDSHVYTTGRWIACR